MDDIKSGVEKLTKDLLRNHKMETDDLKNENLKSQGERLTVELKVNQLKINIKHLERERDELKDIITMLKEILNAAAPDQEGADKNPLLDRIRKTINDGHQQRHSEMEWQPEPLSRRTTSDPAENAEDGATCKRRRVG